MYFKLEIFIKKTLLILSCRLAEKCGFVSALLVEKQDISEKEDESFKMESIVNTANALSAAGRKHMDSKVFEYWLEALKMDKVDTIQEILKACTPSARNLLINGKFLYNKDGNHWLEFSVEACKSVIQGTTWCRPLVLLIAGRAMKTLQFLLNDTHKGTTDVFVRDDGDSNILHALILSSKCTALEDEFICMYQKITQTLNFETKRSLLMQENCA